MTYKLLVCLTFCLFLNGSFTPIGEGKSSKTINYQVRPDYSSKGIEDQIADKMAVLADMANHEQELRLASIISRIQHKRKVDSLTALIKTIKP